MSQRAVSDPERGTNPTARKDTAGLLAGALGLDGPARELFLGPRGAARLDQALAACCGSGRDGVGGGQAGRCRETSPPSPAARPSSGS